jgi:hypothetical protein
MISYTSWKLVIEKTYATKHRQQAGRAEGRQRLSLSLSVIFSFLPLFYRTFCTPKIIEREELLSFWSMGGPKKGPMIPEILFEIRTKKNLEQNLPFGESELELDRFPHSSFLFPLSSFLFPPFLVQYTLAVFCCIVERVMPPWL